MIPRLISLLFFTIYLMVIPALAQTNGISYFIKGNKITQTSEELKFTTRQVEIGGELFGTDEIDEFGLSDGRVFVARQVVTDDNVATYYLERNNHNDPIKLFTLKLGLDVEMFIERQHGELIPIPKSSYKEILKAEMRSCENMEKQIDQSRYDRRIISELLSAFPVCGETFFKRTQVGFLVGTGILKSFASKEDIVFRPEVDFSGNESFAGIWMEIPIKGKFFLKTEITMNSQKIESATPNNQLGFKTNDFVTVQVPVLLGHTISRVKRNELSAFVGPYYSFGQEYNEVRIIRSQPHGIPASTVPQKFAGYMFGIGYTAAILPKNEVKFEIRFLKNSTNSPEFSMINKRLNFAFGMNF